MKRFKVGDRVIKVRTPSEAFLHKEATIIGNGRLAQHRIRLDSPITSYSYTSDEWDAFDNQLELAITYNSPLWKALR